MKIVYSIAGTFNSGGMERALANKANYLVKLGHQLVIVTTDQKGRKPYFEFDPHIVHIDLGIDYSENTGKGLLQKLMGYPLRQRKHRKRLEACLQRLRLTS